MVALFDRSKRIPSTVWLSQVTVGPAAAAAPAGPAVVGAVPAVATLTFTCIALSHDDVALWLDSLAKEKGWSDPYFSTSVEQYIGSHQTYTFTSSVTVTAAALSGRYAIPARADMTKLQQWITFAVVGIVVILAAGWFLLVSPQRAKAAATHTQVTTELSSTASLRTQLDVLRAQARQLPAKQAELAKFSRQIPSTQPFQRWSGH